MTEDEQQPGERPKWSFTWLLRIQRTGRNRAPVADDGPRVTGFWKAVPWIVMLVLGIEIAVGVWMGLLPR
jgi:hypothetical protein